MWLERSYRWRTSTPFLKQDGSDYAITRASPESAARTLAASAQVTITWRGAPSKEGTPGIFHPRSVRPRPSSQDAAGRLLHQDHILSAGPNSLVSGPTAAVHGIAPCPPGYTAPANGATGCSFTVTATFRPLAIRQVSAKDAEHAIPACRSAKRR